MAHFSTRLILKLLSYLILAPSFVSVVHSAEVNAPTHICIAAPCATGHGNSAVINI